MLLLTSILESSGILDDFLIIFSEIFLITFLSIFGILDFSRRLRRFYFYLFFGKEPKMSSSRSESDSLASSDYS
jgi:hypothetical protein